MFCFARAYPVRHSPCSEISPTSLKSTQQGFSFIEVLISLLLFSFAAIALAKSHLFISRMSSDALDTFQANVLLASAGEKIKASGRFINDGDWLAEVARTLPNAEAEYTLNDQQLRVEISWLPAGGSSHEQFRIEWSFGYVSP